MRVGLRGGSADARRYPGFRAHGIQARNALRARGAPGRLQLRAPRVQAAAARPRGGPQRARRHTLGGRARRGRDPARRALVARRGCAGEGGPTPGEGRRDLLPADESGGHGARHRPDHLGSRDAGEEASEGAGRVRVQHGAERGSPRSLRGPAPGGEAEPRVLRRRREGQAGRRGADPRRGLRSRRRGTPGDRPLHRAVRASRRPPRLRRGGRPGARVPVRAVPSIGSCWKAEVSMRARRAAAAAILILVLARLGAQARGKDGDVKHPTLYRTMSVDGVSIFYREAGPKDAPTILLLHGLPSSSRMFEPLFARLSDRYHLVAPDYPGFGHSDWPDPKKFAYTFDHCAEIMNDFTQAVGLSRYTLYMQDYGGPVGFRMLLAHPERAQSLIVQNAVAHNEGLGAIWATRRAFWADRSAHEDALRENLLSLAATKSRHVGSDPKIELYDPDLWTDEFAFLSKPVQAGIQADLFYDYRTNVAAYPKWQAWLQQTQPRLLVLWGKHDPSFDIGEPERFRKDVPNAGIHVLDAGHFALDTKADEMAALLREFMQTQP